MKIQLPAVAAGNSSGSSGGGRSPARTGNKHSMELADDSSKKLCFSEPVLMSPEVDLDRLRINRKIQIAFTVSWIVNIFLFISKAVVWFISQSKAVLVNALDSFVDLMTQVVLVGSELQAVKPDPRFPIGRAKLVNVGVLMCASIMSYAAYAVFQSAGLVLWDGYTRGILPELEATTLVYVVLGASTGLRFVTYWLCVSLKDHSDSMLALAEDHLNDIMTNVGAIVTLSIAVNVQGAWWVDATGGALLSVFIMWRWFDITRLQVDKLVGLRAPDEFVEQIADICNSHHHHLELDRVRAFHFGSKFVVEVDVVLPVNYKLSDVHDLSLQLQRKLESLHNVERAYVHADYMKRAQPEHRTECLQAGFDFYDLQPPGIV